MYVNKLLKIIAIYEAIDKGCPKHRQYRAKRRPRRINCEYCRKLYESREELRKLYEQTGTESL